ncbi:glycoside hydrolase family 3 protein [Aaosphaeria arxii CBS 175.79]|uniref:beta-glucosidase n=1 Tax=Aaosphaeria arxii CBS 175.79 TaxID=1450172 RepID=A0A6A5XKN1_9PLEO|nr:glycoside hydrolase family 3 protein [Aaosphaeria arxii CBS 175.79]KAF2013401.1 glycoside hydrolase family 3 protein [Aaosphaeria arxii CBS 175.79]
MTDINVLNPSLLDATAIKQIDIKQQAAIEVQPISSSPTLAPSSDSEDDKFDDMAGKKVFTLEKPDDRAKELAAKLTLEEQISLLAGADFWRTVAIPEKGIPSIKTTDGPNGARGEFFTNGTPAAQFPCGVSMASTWNLDLMEEIGRHLGDETKARGANVLLAPTVCMHRSPLGGRNFESYSEDPFLTGKLAASYIRGLQSKGVAATIKHFLGNEQETERQAYNAEIAERPLREIYLKPFEIAVRDASPWALMSAYNLVNGTHADEYEHSIKEILRGEWGWDGTMISDWTGTYATAPSIRAGTDIEMPGPSKWRKLDQVLEALEKGELTREDIEKSAARVLYLVDRTKGLNNMTPEPAEASNDNAETRNLILQAGIEGLTLLKNENNVLPIRGANKIALIGPNVKRAISSGGGSAGLNPYYKTTPYDGVKSRFDGEIIFAQGCDSSKWMPLASPYCAYEGQQGVRLEYYRGDRFKGEPAVVQHKVGTDLWLWDSAPMELLPDFSFKVKTSLTPKSTGNHTFSFASVGPGRMFINGEMFIDNWDWTEEGEAMFSASQDVVKSIQLEEGKSIEILIESTSEVRPASKVSVIGRRYDYGGCRIGYQEEDKIDRIQEAVDAAKAADAAVLVVGLDAEWESEGYDRQTMDLPKDGSQDRLIEAVLAANPRTVVVNQSGTPVTMPWVDRAPAILQAWYQGQEAGNALADVLFGNASPSGKLTATFPRRIEDNPAFHNWPGENLKTVYGEGIYIGYRHYERSKIEPLFAFGHGLTYTSFEYGTPEVDNTVLTESNSITVTIPVTNTGSFAAPEIVQAYVKDIRSTLPRPEKELQGFAKVYLQPGETKTVTLKLDKYSAGYFDTALGQTGAWIAEEGAFDVLIGASSADIRTKVSFEVKESFQWIF